MSEGIWKRWPEVASLRKDLRQGKMPMHKFAADLYRTPHPSRLVPGPWQGALSEFVGEPLTLLWSEGGAQDRGNDRGGWASLISRGSLERLGAEAAAQEAVDGRRFRMLFEIGNILGMKQPNLASPLLRILIGYGFQEASPETIYEKTFELMRTFKVTFYDAAYHAVAIKRSGTMITADDAYYRKTARAGHVAVLREWFPV